MREPGRPHDRQRLRQVRGGGDGREGTTLKLTCWVCSAALKLGCAPQPSHPTPLLSDEGKSQMVEGPVPESQGQYLALT